MNPFLTVQTSQQNVNIPEKVLSGILEQEQQCLEQIIQLLITESTAIVERNTILLDSLLDKKIMLLSKLEQQDKQRQLFFEQQTDMPYNHSDFSHFISQYPSESIKSIWHSVKTQLPECKKQNELNGRMINIRKENTEQILQILIGRPLNPTQTYSHLGQTRQQKQSTLYTSTA